MIEISPGVWVEDDDVEISYVRAGGPGGQNVNKVSTAAQLRFDARGCRALPDAVAARLLRLAGSRATKDGVIVISAQRFRTQERNRADALARLAALIERAQHAPAVRKATRPSRAAKERRLSQKAQHSETKAGRGKIRPDND